ncbi:MAG: hypothetical protein AAGA17_15840 [Actinomycetota bacterium]
MRTIVSLALSSLLLLAACGGESASSSPAEDATPETVTAPPPPPADDGGYPEQAVEDFLGGCIPQAGEDICVCAMDVLQAEVPYEEFDAMSGEMEATASLPEDLLSLVVQNCV